MDAESIIHVITKVIANDKAISIPINDSLINYGVNSIVFIKIAVALEDAFDFEFDDDMLQYTLFKTMSDLINYVMLKKNN